MWLARFSLAKPFDSAHKKSFSAWKSLHFFFFFFHSAVHLSFVLEPDKGERLICHNYEIIHVCESTMSYISVHVPLACRNDKAAESFSTWRANDQLNGVECAGVTAYT